MTIRFKILGYEIATLELDGGATPNTITPLDRGVKGLSNWFYHRMTK